MQRLEHQTQAYAWGSTTSIPQLLGLPESTTPVAELWLGAHPLAPSKVNGTPLNEMIAARPSALLGDSVVKQFGPTLPFLLKVLAAAKPLSLQAHPSRAQAEAGFARENAAGLAASASNRNYKDANHKPELICALTPFRALCGFRDAAKSHQFFSALDVPALSPLVDALKSASVRGAFEWVMTRPNADRAAIVDAVIAACRARPVRAFEAECANALSLAATYPGDIGVVAAMLLNLVTLSPGEALALGAGNLHAYLEGTGVELMANSDNVLRGGLTPKHVDVPELLHVLDFHHGPVEVLTPRGAPEAVYETPFRDFRLSRISVDTAVTLTRRGPDILLCVDGSVNANGTPLERGQSAFAAFDEGPLTLTGRGTLFRATVNT